MSSTQQWPLTGTRTAKVGQTIKSSYKKKPTGAGPGKKVEREFHAVRYNFKPQGMDTEKPASMDVSHYKDDHGSVSKIVLERPIVNDDVFVFEGVEKPMQFEYDCVLIWDESLQTLTLERVESHINLTHMGQRPPTKRISSQSPAATPEASGSTSAIGSPVKQEPEESEEDVPIVKAVQPTKRPLPFQSKAKPSTAAPLQTAIPTSSAVPSPVSTKPRPRPAKRADPLPASPPPAKRPRTPPKSFGLTLPTSGSTGLAFPLLSTQAPPVKSEPVPEPVVAPVQLVEDDEDEEDDMEEVEPEVSTYSPAANELSAPTPEPVAVTPEPARAFSSSFVMEEVEGDEEEAEPFDDAAFDAAFAADLETAMGGEGDEEDEEEDDDDMEAVEPDSAPVAPPSGDGPISLNAYAGGGGMYEDEYSDSEESD
ncbi:hypothetical protein PENSPDRAFT_407566 [Peniophora sp. CONT]|nr:hypothetical protein PENSPDRAFT_407566 [Peniophora sp. CONT]